ncbi:MAG TPA: GntR family transcriptional regulator [Puia sp.]|nr:GntR family transcriptional regulator [Puia sp.]
MEFRENPAIYIQIAEYVCEQILLKKWKTGERIISIRDLAVKLQVNPITVQRSYDLLQQREIISNKRGIGFFVEDEASNKIIAFRKEQFLENELPVFLKNLYLLKIDINEIKSRLDQFVKENYKNIKL